MMETPAAASGEQHRRPPRQGDGTDETAQCRFIRSFVESMPASGHLGLVLDSIEPGRTMFEMVVRSEHTVDGTTVQAAFIAAIADYAAVCAAGSVLPTGWQVATTSFNVHNLAPARGALLVAEGTIVKPGRQHLVASADVYCVEDGARRHCLTGLFTATGLRPVESAAVTR